MKSLREINHLSQLDVANEIGISQAAIAQYERGRSCAPVEIIDWYHTKFDASFDYLFGHTDIINNEKIVKALSESENAEAMISHMLDKLLEKKNIK